MYIRNELLPQCFSSNFRNLKYLLILSERIKTLEKEVSDLKSALDDLRDRIRQAGASSIITGKKGSRTLSSITCKNSVFHGKKTKVRLNLSLAENPESHFHFLNTLRKKMLVKAMINSLMATAREEMSMWVFAEDPEGEGTAYLVTEKKKKPLLKSL